MAKGGEMEGGGKKGGKFSALREKVVKLWHILYGWTLTRLAALSTIGAPVLSLYIVVFMLLFSSLRGRAGGSTEPRIRYEEVPYSSLLQETRKGRVEEALLGGSTVKFRLKDGSTLMARVPRAPPDLLSVLDKHHVPFRQAKAAAGELLVPYIGLIVYVGVVLYFGWKTFGRGSSGSAGKRAQVNTLDKSLSFNDIAGIDAAKAQVMQVVDILKRPAKYSRLGAKQPTGVLLVGPPGTGKTLLARVIAGSLGLPFFYASGSDFVEMFVGRGAARVRELFGRAKKAAPCVIFLDELDALGKSRGGGMQLVRNDEGEQTLNQLLASMDGIDTKNSGIVIIAATNRFDVLDEALTRPGRFDRVVRVPMPDREGRLQVLRVHARATVLDASVQLDKIADATDNFSPAELAAIINEGVISAAARNADAVSQEDLETVLYTYKVSRGKGTFLGRFK